MKGILKKTDFLLWNKPCKRDLCYEMSFFFAHACVE